MSSSSNDTEIVVENQAQNSKMIRTPPRGNATNTNNSRNVVVQASPGQIVPYHQPPPPPQQQQQQEAKRLTQNIAAIAAQRKAKQHHRELMQELMVNGEAGSESNENSLNLQSESLVMTSKNDENKMLMLLEKKNSTMTDSSNQNYYPMTNSPTKVKKQVKIKDIVQFKLPDESFYGEEMMNRLNLSRNDVSPIMVKQLGIFI